MTIEEKFELLSEENKKLVILEIERFAAMNARGEEFGKSKTTLKESVYRSILKEMGYKIHRHGDLYDIIKADTKAEVITGLSFGGMVEWADIMREVQQNA